VADGRVPLVVELLSPAQRPLQITADLAAFWAGSYEQVKKR
jgi:ATP-dependent helicase HrpB